MLPLVCILLVALLGAAALAVDLGRLYYTTAELQAVADPSALAAASALQLDPSSAQTGAVSRAQQIAVRNRVAGLAASVLAADVLPVIYDPVTRTTKSGSYSGSANAVQVTVRARSPNVLAGGVGLAPVTAARTAVAWIANVNGAGCVRPLAPPYTRIYEDINGLTSRPYTSQSLYAPDWTQAQLAKLAPANGVLPSNRTFVLVPPWHTEAHWDSLGKPNTGSWHTVNYAGAGYSAYTTFIGEPVGSTSCALATTQVGDYLHPFSWQLKDTVNLLAYAKPGFVTLCNRSGNAPDATCRTASGAVGVRTRMALSDSIPNPIGPFSQKVRMVSQLRVMCYFQSTSDVCAATTIVDAGGALRSWQMPSASSGGPPVDKGYPAGTLVVLLDAPAAVDLTPDVVLGPTLSLSQRLILVK